MQNYTDAETQKHSNAELQEHDHSVCDFTRNTSSLTCFWPKRGHVDMQELSDNPVPFNRQTRFPIRRVPQVPQDTTSPQGSMRQ